MYITGHFILILFKLLVFVYLPSTLTLLWKYEHDWHSNLRINFQSISVLDEIGKGFIQELLHPSHRFSNNIFHQVFLLGGFWSHFDWSYLWWYLLENTAEECFFLTPFCSRLKSSIVPSAHFTRKMWLLQHKKNRQAKLKLNSTLHFIYIS